MNSFLNHFSYKIRTTSFSLNGFYPEKENAAPYAGNLYIEDKHTIKSFLETQIFVNEAYLSLLMKRDEIQIMNENERKGYENKAKWRQAMVESAYEMMDEYNRTLDFPNNQSAPDTINDINQKIINLINEKLLFNNLENLFEIKYVYENIDKHAEFIRERISQLGTEHPLFIQNIRAMRMPYPQYVERPPTSLIDLIPYVLTNGFIILAPVIVSNCEHDKIHCFEKDLIKIFFFFVKSGETNGR